MITASIRSIAHLDELLAKGVKAERLVAWTGTSAPNPELWKALAARSVESAFGTLGARGQSLDDKYWEDQSAEEYRELADAGLVALVTDVSDRASRELAGLRQKSVACGF